MSSYKSEFTADLEIGKAYIMFIPPGWLIGATIDSFSGDGLSVSLKDIVHLESVSNGNSTIGAPAMAPTPDKLSELVTACYTMADGSILRKDAILIASPCKVPMTVLARKAQKDAIKRAA